MPKDETVDLLEPIPEKKGGWKWIAALLALLLAGGATYYLINRGSGEPDARVNSGNPAGPTEVAAANASPSPSPAASPSPASATTPGSGAGTSAPAKAETVNFGFNRAEVPPANAPRLRSLWNEISGKATTVTIEGHTDGIGSDEYNQKLSELRAENVASSLRKLGMDQKFKVNVRGLGRGKPTADNTTNEGRARNRRVEISYND